MVFLLFYYEVTFWCSFRVESLAIQCIRCMQPIFLLVFITHWENTQLKILQDDFHGISSMAPSRYSSLTFFKPRGIQCFQWQNCSSRNKLRKFLLWAVRCTKCNNCLQRMLRLQKQAVIKARNTKIKVVCANSGCANAQPEPISLRDSLFFPSSFIRMTTYLVFTRWKATWFFFLFFMCSKPSSWLDKLPLTPRPGGLKAEQPVSLKVA